MPDPRQKRVHNEERNICRHLQTGRPIKQGGEQWAERLPTRSKSSLYRTHCRGIIYALEGRTSQHQTESSAGRLLYGLSPCAHMSCSSVRRLPTGELDLVAEQACNLAPADKVSCCAQMLAYQHWHGSKDAAQKLHN